MKAALAACQGALGIQDAALAAAETFGLGFEVSAILSALMMVVVAVARALWVHYAGTPFILDRKGFIACIFKET